MPEDPVTPRVVITREPIHWADIRNIIILVLSIVSTALTTLYVNDDGKEPIVNPDVRPVLPLDAYEYHVNDSHGNRILSPEVIAVSKLKPDRFTVQGIAPPGYPDRFLSVMVVDGTAPIPPPLPPGPPGPEPPVPPEPLPDAPFPSPDGLSVMVLVDDHVEARKLLTPSQQEILHPDGKVVKYLRDTCVKLADGAPAFRIVDPDNPMDKEPDPRWKKAIAVPHPTIQPPCIIAACKSKGGVIAIEPTDTPDQIIALLAQLKE